MSAIPVLTPVVSQGGRARSSTARLAKYVELFNARDFDAIRRLLADDVKLELVGKLETSGVKAVRNYFRSYDGKYDWRLVPGVADGQPAALVCDPLGDLPGPEYCIVLSWNDDKVVRIRDFRYTRYAVEETSLRAC